jgi:hypothetical protein
MFFKKLKIKIAILLHGGTLIFFRKLMSETLFSRFQLFMVYGTLEKVFQVKILQLQFYNKGTTTGTVNRYADF